MRSFGKARSGALLAAARPKECGLGPRLSWRAVRGVWPRWFEADLQVAPQLSSPSHIKCRARRTGAVEGTADSATGI